MSPEACDCSFARDESDHSTQDKHYESSQYIRQCSEHNRLDTPPLIAAKHNASKWIALAALSDSLPDHAWLPVFREDAEPERLVDAGGKTIGWRYDPGDVVQRRIIHPAEVVMNFRTHQLCIRHYNSNQETLSAMHRALREHPKSIMTLADPETHDAVFALHDEHLRNLPDARKRRFVIQNVQYLDPVAKVFWDSDIRGVHFLSEAAISTIHKGPTAIDRKD